MGNDYDNRGGDTAPSATAPTPRQKFVTLILMFLGVIGVVVFAVVTQRQDDRRKERSQPAFSPVTQQITESTVTLPGGKYVSFKFVVPQKSQNVTVEGNFQVSGEPGHDVDVFLVDQDGFSAWGVRQQFRTLYRSGPVMSDKLDVSLPESADDEPAVCFVVFNNNATSTDRVVNADLQAVSPQKREAQSKLVRMVLKKAET